MRQTPPAYNGVLLIDKDPGPTSHDVVAICRRILKEKRIGHLGTLDPIAGGLLPLAIGKATRLTRFFLMARKSYRGTIRLGFSTDTFDRTGTPTSEERTEIPAEAAIHETVASLRGRIQHMTPPYSAKKVGGKKLYELARKGEMVTTELKEVEIFAFDIESLRGQYIDFFVDCSTGTYVRTLANEIGLRLGCGAHLDALRRVTVGEFSIERAVTLDALRDMQAAGRAAESIVPMAQLLAGYGSIQLSSADMWEIGHGKDILRKVDTPPAGRYVKLIEPGGELAAIGEVVDRHSVIITIHPAVVLTQ